jgi:hypothetical protein
MTKKKKKKSNSVYSVSNTVKKHLDSYKEEVETIARKILDLKHARKFNLIYHRKKLQNILITSFGWHINCYFHEEKALWWRWEIVFIPPYALHKGNYHIQIGDLKSYS